MSRGTRRGRRRMVAGALATIIAVTACSDRDGPSDATPGGAGGTPEAAAAELAGYRFETPEGDDASLADFAGRPVVLNFFASWCGPCRAEMADLESVSRAAGDDVAFVGLLVNDSVEAGQAMVDDTGITYPWGTDSDGLLVDFDGIAMPTTVFIDADGEIVESHVGALTIEQLHDKLSDFFGVEVA